MTVAKSVRAVFMSFICCASALSVAFAQADYANSSETFSAKRAYEQARLSPDGKHLALMARVNDQASLVIFETSNMNAVAALSTEDQQDILQFWWANDERVIVNLALRNLTVDYPLLTGELYALNVDNTRKFAVAGFSAGDTANYEFLDAYAPNKKEIRVIRSDIRNRRNTELQLSRPVAYNLDIYKRFRQSTGTNLKDKRLEKPFNSPYADGGFVTDNNGELRLAYHIDENNELRFSKRDAKESAWVEYDFSSSMFERQKSENPIVGFDAENEGVFYLGKSQFGTVGLFHVNLESGEARAVYEHEQIDLRTKDLIRASDRDVIGVNLMGSATAQFFDKTHPEAGRLRGLVKAFTGNRVEVLNYSSRGEYALIDVIGTGSESGLYLFEGSNNSVSLLMPSRS